MQIFEALEVREFPYFLTVEVTEGETVRDVLTDLNSHKVYLLVDHDTKRIWTYNGQTSPFKLQILGGILAGMLRKQLRLFYRIYPLNRYIYEDPIFLELLDKPLGAGRAKSIDKKDFPKTMNEASVENLVIHNPRLKMAVENLSSYPIPGNYMRIFLVIGGILYSEEEHIESILTEKRTTTELLKMGRLNNGFTFFSDRNYSCRIIVKDRAIQGLELFIHEHDEMPSLRIKSPVIQEVKFSNEGKIESLINAFNIPDSLPDVKEQNTQQETEEN